MNTIKEISMLLLKYRLLHTETLEELVVYRAIYGDGELWARPKKMFLDNIEKDGKIIPRFKLIKKL